jgi:hypothetical protein
VGPPSIPATMRQGPSEHVRSRYHRRPCGWTISSRLEQRLEAIPTDIATPGYHGPPHAIGDHGTHHSHSRRELDEHILEREDVEEQIAHTVGRRRELPRPAAESAPNPAITRQDPGDRTTLPPPLCILPTNPRRDRTVEAIWIALRGKCRVPRPSERRRRPWNSPVARRTGARRPGSRT